MGCLSGEFFESLNVFWVDMIASELFDEFIIVDLFIGLGRHGVGVDFKVLFLLTLFFFLDLFGYCCFLRRILLLFLFG